MAAPEQIPRAIERRKRRRNVATERLKESQASDAQDENNTNPNTKRVVMQEGVYDKRTIDPKANDYSTLIERH